MRKKIFGIIVSFALVTTIFVYQNLNNNTSKFDLLLSNIEALAEVEQGQMANKCCPIWNITYTQGGGLWPTISCSTGGSYKCENCTCPR